MTALGPANATPVTTSRGGAVFWVMLWLCLVVVGLDVVRDPTVYDKTLVPRLHALLVVLGCTFPTLALPRIARRLDTSVLWEPVVMCAVAYAACTSASLLLAVNASAGLLDVVRTWACTAVLVLACLFLPLLPRWPERLIQVLVVSSMVTAGLGWYELVTKHGLGLHPRLSIEDVSGRMGNINLLANYLVLVLPGCLAAGCLLHGFWRMLGGFAAVTSIALIVLLQSRSAYVGLAAGVVAAALAAGTWPQRLDLGPAFRRLLGGGALTAACGVVTFAALAGPDHPVVSRLRSIGEARRADGHLSDGGRTMIWRLTGRMIADHPVGGVGAGQFPLRISEYYAAPGADIAALHTDNWSRPHNDVLNVWAEKGLVGLVAFAGTFVSAFIALGTTIRRADAPVQARLAVFLLMAAASYLVSSCFDFPLERISHQATLAVMLAAVVVLRREAVPRAVSASHGSAGVRGEVLRAGAVSAAVLASGAGIAWTTVALDQERDAIAARDAIEKRRWDEAVHFARRATTPWRTLDPFGTPVAFLEGAAEMQRGEVGAAIACLERARRDHPNRLVVLNNLGILYAATGRTDEAIACLVVARERYPHRLESVANLAGCYLDAGRPADAVTLLEGVPEARRTAVMRDHLARGRAMLGRSADAPETVPSR